MDYFGFDDFLLGEEEIPITVDQYSKGVGFLSDQPGNDIDENTSIQLPFWLGYQLHLDGFARIEILPEILNQDMMKEIQATNYNLTEDRYKELDLNALTTYYFDLSVSYYHLVGNSENTEEELREEIERIMDVVRDAFAKRYKSLVESSFFKTEKSEEVENINWTSVETTLFEKGDLAAGEFDYWERYLKEKNRPEPKKRKRGIDFSTKSKRQKL